MYLATIVTFNYTQRHLAWGCETIQQSSCSGGTVKYSVLLLHLVPKFAAWWIDSCVYKNIASVKRQLKKIGVLIF